MLHTYLQRSYLQLINQYSIIKNQTHGHALIFGAFFGLLIFLIVANWKIYVKAGQPGWAGIIPVYNYWVTLKIIGKPAWWMIMFLLPVLNLIFLIWNTNLLSKSFGKSTGFTIGLILLPFVFYPMLGFGNARYLGPFGDQAAFKALNPQFDFEQNR